MYKTNGRKPIRIPDTVMVTELKANLRGIAKLETKVMPKTKATPNFKLESWMVEPVKEPVERNTYRETGNA